MVTQPVAMDEFEMQELYSWIDELPLSRPKRHIARDFSDGVLAAEIVKHFVPKLVELHNYQPANSTSQKVTNWTTLNHKVFKKLGLNVPKNVIQGVAAQKHGVIEVVLNNLRLKLQQYLAPPRSLSDMGAHSMYDANEAEEEYDPTPPPPPRARGGKKRGGALPPLGGGRSQGGMTSRRSAPRMVAQPRGPPVSSRGGHYDDYGGYDSTTAELEECRRQMSLMQVKIDKLERLSKLKDKRIEELQRSIAGHR
eukprot:m.39896 g.39896  ORF g.39896 m.39896 type:complete len:252 (+) comp5885_c0_seq1:318-1073(+)